MIKVNLLGVTLKRGCELPDGLVVEDVVFPSRESRFTRVAAWKGRQYLAGEVRVGLSHLSLIEQPPPMEDPAADDRWVSGACA